MSTSNSIQRAVRYALLTSAAVALPAHAADDENVQEVVVTGTRITAPGTVSSSPIYSIGADEIQLQQQPEVEKILRLLPITAPSDGQNANNGTDGVATINLRSLGAQRNLIMINGKRVTPYNFDGVVDTSAIPTALIERIDIVTGGASAVYGSDAISGALNFILKRDFEGVEINSNLSQTGDSDGDVRSASMTMGANLADGRGNIVLSIDYTDRKGLQLGARPLGLLGIDSADGAGYAEFLAGQAPPAPPAGCGGLGSVDSASSGSTTTLPTRVAIVGGPGLGQFREDGSLGANCSVFNFNPFNYYQTPQERFGGTVIGGLEINEHAKPYARFAYSSTEVRQQIAPSGVFGTPFWTPLANPFITAGASNTILNAANAGVGAGTVIAEPSPDANWRDVNANGVVDAADYLNISYRRRTVEFDERSTTFNNKAFQFVIGTEGDIVGDWDYDVSFQYGDSQRTNIDAGYTNVTNIANALDSVDGVTCRNGDPTCVPINLFGGFGAITPQMAAYSSASAIEQQNYDQKIATAVATGPISPVQIPWASNPLSVSVGVEYREENAETIPDECLKLAPESCLGGKGANTLPIAGGFDVQELFAEAILPLVNDRPGFQALDIELGYRYSDYDITGADDTYKYGLNWRPVDQFMVRAMRQRATRAPNVGELFSPITSGLDNATLDPCSLGNPTIDATLRARCISTGQTDPQVGTVEDITAGQVNAIFGSDPGNLPQPESADTTTLGLVWTPDFGGVIKNTTLSVDYYDIDIDDVIGEFTAQQVLDSCYVLGEVDQCAKIVRVGGTVTLPGSGVTLLTRNLVNLQAEGLEVGFSFGVEIGRFGDLTFMGNVNKYLTREFTTSTTLAELDCLGYYGTACGSAPGDAGPLPGARWIQRTTWSYDDFQVSALWRHMGSVSVHPGQRASTFEAFRKIDSRDYFDLYASWSVLDNVKISGAVSNLFDKDPPVVGNEAADTRSNSGNTFPSTYDVLGRIYSLGLNVTF